MAHYVIGDIQGCYQSLVRLLRRMPPLAADDRLWLVGDLVNRGPDSLAVLRWAMAHDPRLVAVLGNHDLHLLARAAGLADAKKRDTLDTVLAAPDLSDIVDWLRHRPLLHVEPPWVLVHAGLLPRWKVGEAQRLAAEAEATLRGPHWRDLLAALLRPGRNAKLRAQVEFIQVVTRIRTCQADGTPHTEFSGEPADAPAGCRPWFDMPRRNSRKHVVVFGHWAALGLYLRPDIRAVDSGCVWGRQLSGLRLEDGSVWSEPSELGSRPDVRADG